jgi:hypothetical protein
MRTVSASASITSRMRRQRRSLYLRYCCKSRFAMVVGNSAGRRCDFRVKMWGASSPHVKLTGDLANVSAAIRIGDCFSFRNFAKNQSPCNFRLLQQYPSESDCLLRCRETTLRAISDILRCRKATAEQVERPTRQILIACDGGISAKLWQKIARRARKRVAIRPPRR